MPYVDAKLPVCNRCHHVWLPDLEDDTAKPARLDHLRWILAPRKIPKTCANCKSPYWDSRRKHKKHTRPLTRKPRSTPAQIRGKVAAMSGAEIFENVMKAVKPK